MHKKDQGKLGEALVIAQALKAGTEAFVDFGDNSKIDVILNTSQGLIRVQVKCVGREADTPDCAKLYLYKAGPNYSFKYEEDHVDYFALVDLQTNRIAWIPASKDLYKRSKVSFRMDDKQHGSIKQRFSDFEDFPFGPLAQ